MLVDNDFLIPIPNYSFSVRWKENAFFSSPERIQNIYNIRRYFSSHYQPRWENLLMDSQVHKTNSCFHSGIFRILPLQLRISNRVSEIIMTIPAFKYIRKVIFEKRIFYLICVDFALNGVNSVRFNKHLFLSISHTVRYRNRNENRNRNVFLFKAFSIFLIVQVVILFILSLNIICNSELPWQQNKTKRGGKWLLHTHFINSHFKWELN